MKKTFAKTVMYIILVLGSVIALFPFVWTYIAATHTDGQIFRLSDSFIPGTHFIENFILLQKQTPIWNNLFNSLFVSITYTAIVLVIDSMAAYGFAKYKFKGRDFLFFIVLISMMIPHQVVLIPLFIEMMKFHWIDNEIAVILPQAASVFGVFLMRQNLLAFPDSLIDASRIDGASEFRTFATIVVPSMKSTFTALAILSFVNQWGAYLWPLIVLNSKTNLTMPLVLALFVQPGTEVVRYSIVFCGAAISLLPVLVFFLIFQKNFINGILSGAIKE